MNNGDIILVEGVYYLSKMHPIGFEMYVIFMGLNKLKSHHIELNDMPNNDNLLDVDLGFGKIEAIFNRKFLMDCFNR